MTEKEVVSLRDYFDQRISDLERLIEVEIKMRDRAIETAREESQQVTQLMLNRLTSMETWRANVTGRVVGVGAIGVIFTAVTVAIITHLLV